MLRELSTNLAWGSLVGWGEGGGGRRSCPPPWPGALLLVGGAVHQLGLGVSCWWGELSTTLAWGSLVGVGSCPLTWPGGLLACC